MKTKLNTAPHKTESSILYPNNHTPKKRLSERLFTRYVASILVLFCFLFAATSADADVVTDWNAIMQDTVASPDPVIQVRSAAITQLAVFEAVNAIVGDYKPYVGRISAPEGASPEAAAIAAAHRALVVLYPANGSVLDELRAKSLAAIPDGPAKTDGIAVGVAAANVVLELRADDGSNKVIPYTPGTDVGDWQPTPPDFAPAFRPGWGQVTTFGIKNGAHFRSVPPPNLSSPKYAHYYNEVKKFGDVNSTERPQDRKDVALFYGVTDVVPIYNPAARQVSKEQGKTLSENARIFALLNIAIFDAAVSVFETKYFYNLWRPVTAIRAGDRDGNRKTDPDSHWLSLVSTPPFPSYPSGHASVGGAARRVLESMFGPNKHSIVLTNPLLPEVVLRYSSWKQLTDDIDDARVFGGVHYRFDQEAGARQGWQVGSYILRHLLTPMHGSD
jgi:hypothetical protein